MTNEDILNGRLTRDEKEERLRQRARTIWMTGLSGAGKTTIALALERELFKQGFFVQLLDGDDVRNNLNKDLSFSPEDRTENIRRIAEVNRLFNNSAVITINCFISPTNEIRDMAREIIGAGNFIEVYIKASLEVCEKRDVKGLYAKARAGLIKDFTGIGAPYDVPQNPDLILETANESPDESARKAIEFILPRITWNANN
jgi:adenylylsulfate kinase